MTVERPAVGALVEVTWVDSGLDTNGRPDEASLAVCKSRGRVIKVGKDKTMRDAARAAGAPKDWACEAIVLEMCSSGPTLGVIWWPSVIAVTVFPG